jgi:hypothetical protein
MRWKEHFLADAFSLVEMQGDPNRLLKIERWS